MFESLSQLALQEYWWILVSILGSILVFLMFVQGGQTLIGQIAENSTEKSMLINSIGRKWDLTFTTLVTFGGAFFASFPVFYATSFGGAYWVWLLILFGFIVQAVSYEYRSKPSNFLGEKTFDIFLLINGVLATVLVGAAVGTFFSGSAFSVTRANLGNASNPTISQWQSAFHGLEAAFNVQNLMLGLTVLFLARILGAMYFINSIDNPSIEAKARKQVKINAIPFLIAFLTFAVILISEDGFAVNPQTGIISMESFKYLHNLLAMPMVLILFLVGVVGVLYGIFITIFKSSQKGIWSTGLGTVLTVFALFCVAGFNNTAYYPSTFDLQSSLTIQNSSSSHYTLTAMSYVSLVIPFVIAYIWYAWKSINNKKITIQEIEETDHKY